MSDPQTQTPATPPSTPAPAAPTSSPATESVGSGPNQVIFENPTPTTPVAAPPTNPEPYKVAHLENGQYEVILESGQVYRGTQEAVLGELAKAQFHATRTIAEMKGKIPPPPVEQPLQPGQVDPTALALADLVAQGEGFQNAAEKKAFYQSTQSFIEAQQINTLAATFLSKTPDFPMSDANTDKIDAEVQRFFPGQIPTLEQLQLVHNHLKATGQYERVATAAQNGTQPLPGPPNGHSTEPGAVNPWTMPLDQLGEMIRRG